MFASSTRTDRERRPKTERNYVRAESLTARPKFPRDDCNRAVGTSLAPVITRPTKFGRYVNGSIASNNGYVVHSGATGTKLDVNGRIRHAPAAFSTLTACNSTLEGTRAAVTDSTVSTWGTSITGGGANHVLAYCNGTNWTVAAK